MPCGSGRSRRPSRLPCSATRTLRRMTAPGRRGRSFDPASYPLGERAMSTTPRCDEFQPPTRKGGIATLPSSTAEAVEGRSHPSCWRLEGRDAGGAELEAQARRPRESKRARARDTNPCRHFLIGNAPCHIARCVWHRDFLPSRSRRVNPPCRAARGCSGRFGASRVRARPSAGGPRSRHGEAPRSAWGGRARGSRP
jgi:hypothetical protein